VRRGITLLLGSAVAIVVATPAAAADVQVQGLDTLVWDKPEVTVAAGDTVRWTFDGTTQPHNVLATSPNWAGFRSNPGVPAPAAERTFTEPGFYAYVCEIHPNTMVGKVTVTDATGAPPPLPPPPPLSEQPLSNDGALPSVPGTGELVLETGGLDTRRPTLSSVRVRRAGRGARVSFRVSERSRVTVRFKRGGRIVKTAKLSASGGYRGTFRKGLRAGRYRVELRAEDVAGNRSGLRAAHVMLR
jgi:plastocyanin